METSVQLQRKGFFLTEPPEIVEPKVSMKCGEVKKDGNSCENWAMSNGYCRFHGGSNDTLVPHGQKVYTPKPYGIYNDGLHESEKSVYEEIELGQLDDELRMLKIKLARTYRAQTIWERQNRFTFDEHLSKSQRMTNPFTGKKIKKIQRVNDYTNEITKLTKLITSLELKRAELLEMNQDSGTLQLMALRRKLITPDGTLDEEVIAIAGMLKGMRKSDLKILKKRMEQARDQR